MNKEELKQLLEKMIPSIKKIDGGCGDCIDGFIDGINPIIKEHGFEFEQTFGYPTTVILKTLESDKKSFVAKDTWSPIPPPPPMPTAEIKDGKLIVRNASAVFLGGGSGGNNDMKKNER